MRDGGGVVHAELSRLRNLGGAGGRSDAIDHGVGETGVRLDPIGQHRIGHARERHDRLAQDIAVALQVVAAEPGERPLPRIAAQPQGSDYGPKGRARGLGMGRVMDNIGVGSVEPLAHRIDVIAAFGHRQPDDADDRVGHDADQRAVALFDRQVVDHRPHNLSRGLRGVEFDQRRQTVLRQELFPHRRIIGAHARAKDRPIMRFATLHQTVQIPRLMRAVKIAHADMNDAGCQGAAIIGGACDVQIAQRRI